MAGSSASPCGRGHGGGLRPQRALMGPLPRGVPRPNRIRRCVPGRVIDDRHVKPRTASPPHSQKFPTRVQRATRLTGQVDDHENPRPIFVEGRRRAWIEFSGCQNSPTTHRESRCLTKTNAERAYLDRRQSLRDRRVSCYTRAIRTSPLSFSRGPKAATVKDRTQRRQFMLSAKSAHGNGQVSQARQRDGQGGHDCRRIRNRLRDHAQDRPSS